MYDHDLGGLRLNIVGERKAKLEVLMRRTDIQPLLVNGNTSRVGLSGAIQTIRKVLQHRQTNLTSI